MEQQTALIQPINRAEKPPKCRLRRRITYPAFVGLKIEWRAKVVPGVEVVIDWACGHTTTRWMTPDHMLSEKVAFFQNCPCSACKMPQSDITQ